MTYPKGVLLPTTSVWDVSEIYSTDVNSDQFKELLVRLYRNINDIALAVNEKTTGVYDNESEVITSQKFFPNPLLSSGTSTAPTPRDIYRKVVDFGALPATGTKSVAHGIPKVGIQHRFIKISGAASDTTSKSYLPIPYASGTSTDIISMSIDATNVNITVGKDRSAYDVYVYLEYIT